MAMSYDDWLEAPYQEECARQEAYENRVSELMNGDYNPEDWGNFTDSMADATPDEIETFTDYLERNEFEKLGRALWALSMDRMEKKIETYFFELGYNTPSTKGKTND